MGIIYLNYYADKRSIVVSTELSAISDPSMACGTRLRELFNILTKAPSAIELMASNVTTQFLED